MRQFCQNRAVFKLISMQAREKSVVWLPRSLGQLATIWSIDSYHRRFGAYIRLKRHVLSGFEQETCLLSRSTFCGRFMSQNGFRAKLCVKKTIFDSSIQAQSPGGFMSQKWRSYGLSDIKGK